MATPATLNPELKKIVKKKDDYISGVQSELENKVESLQKKLLNLIQSDYMTRFDYDEGGNIIRNRSNMSLLNDLSSVIDDFNSEFQDSVFKKYGQSLLDITGYSLEYYLALGIAEKSIGKLKDWTEILSQQIGIDKKGNLIPGGYLDRLSQTPDVKKVLSDYVTRAVNEQYSLKDFSKGFKDLITGTPDTDGKLERYYGQYVYDTMSQTAQATDNYLADQLELEYFIYEGTIIGTSRQFCEDHTGHVYSRAEGEAFNNEIWEGKAGDFFIDRGGYNCRHWLNWISVEMAAEYGHPGAISQLANAA